MKKDIVMPYGVFKGRRMYNIPSKYLHWIAENFDDEEVCVEADKEWRWREKYNEHWEE